MTLRMIPKIASRVRNSFLSLVLLMFGAAQPMISHAADTIRFAPEKDYGPFVYVDEKNEVRGLSVDMLAAISQSAGMKIETLPARSLSEILVMAERGEVDLISSLRPTPERAKFLNFSSPYVSVPAVLLTRASDSSIKNLDALNGKPVAVGKGYAVENFVRTRFPNVQWTPVTDDAAAIHALQARTVDGVVADIASIGFVIRQEKLTGLAVQSPIGFEYSLSFGYSKKRPEIGEALERGMLGYRGADRNSVLQQWLKVDAMDSTDHKREVIQYVIAILVVVSIVILAFSLFWQRRAGRKNT